MKGKHKCPYCDVRHERAGDSMTHITDVHADMIAFKRFNDRGYARREKSEPCPKCGTMMMPALASCCPCGYEVPTS